MDMTELEDTLGSVKDKVDGIFEVLDKLDSESERMGRLAKSFSVRKKALDNQTKRLKQYVLYSMDMDGTTCLFGETHKIGLHSRKSMKVKDIEVDSELFMEYPEVITREYRFEKNVLKDKYKADPKKYEELMEESETKHIKFSVK
jgi:hypothetical protein